MKRKLVFFLGAFLLISCIASGDRITTVKASGDYTNPELVLTEVEDIVPYSNYIKNNISINTATTYPNCNDGYQYYKITLDEDGYISLYLASRNVKKITQQYGTKSSTTSVPASLTATVYRDNGLLYPVTPTITAKGTTAAQSPQKIALDKGTYYIGLKTDEYSNTNNNGLYTVVSVVGIAELIIYYQPVESYEQYRPSMVSQENPIELETAFKGMLTAPNPKDYYKFVLKDKALVKINCMYSSVIPAMFTLYSGEDREVLVTKSIAGGNVWYNVEKYLEPGTYYFSLETTKQYDGGTTSVIINPTIYPLTLEQENQTTNSYITVATIDAPMEIRYVLGKLTNSELASPKWNKGKIITDTLLFGVNKVGDYTVRVTDQYGNMFMQTIRVTNCDKKAPNAPAIKTYAVDTFVITGTAEKNSLVTVNVNGKIYTCVATSKGVYKCTLPAKLVKGSSIEVTAQDISGNVSEKAEVMIDPQ